MAAEGADDQWRVGSPMGEALAGQWWPLCSWSEEGGAGTAQWAEPGTWGEALGYRWSPADSASFGCTGKPAPLPKEN